jgi:glycosyltransferase 2 family protein
MPQEYPDRVEGTPCNGRVQSLCAGVVLTWPIGQEGSFCSHFPIPHGTYLAGFRRTDTVSNRLQNIIRILVVLAALGLAVFALRGVDLGKTLEIISRANIWLLVLTLVAQFASLTGRVARWKRALSPAGYVPFWRTASPLMISFFVGNITFTGVGAVPRVYVLKRKSGIDEGFAVGTIAQEIVVDATVLVLICVIAPLFVALPPALRALQLLFILPLIVLLLIDAAMVRHKSMFLGVLRRFGLWSRLLRLLPRVITGNLDRFGDGMGAVFLFPKLAAGYVVMTILIWTADGAMFWLLIHSLGIDLGFLQATTVMGYTNALISTVVVPGFIGTLELSSIGLMLSLGVPQAASLAFTALLRVFLLLPSIVIGLIFAAREGFNFTNHPD